MIKHLEAADSLGRTCNFKFGSAESEITEDVPLPRDDSIVTGHSRKRSLPTEKGCVNEELLQYIHLCLVFTDQ